VARRAALTATVLFFFAWLIDYIDRMVITIALPGIGREFALDRTEMGLVLTVFFVAYAVFQLPGGFIADRLGTRPTVAIAMTMWSAFTALTGAATGYLALLATRFCFGVFEGIYPAAAMKAIAERTSQRSRMTAEGGMFTSTMLGTALAPLVAGPAIALIGWRNAFFAVACRDQRSARPPTAPPGTPDGACSAAR
jgi:MFS family permease